MWFLITSIYFKSIHRFFIILYIELFHLFITVIHQLIFKSSNLIFFTKSLHFLITTCTYIIIIKLFYVIIYPNSQLIWLILCFTISFQFISLDQEFSFGVQFFSFFVCHDNIVTVFVSYAVRSTLILFEQFVLTLVWVSEF